MLGHKISGKKLRDFKSHSLQLKLTNLELRGRAGWDSKLCNSNTNTTPICDSMPLNTDADTQPTINYPACFTSPCCSTWELSTNSGFQLVDLDRRIVCKNCKKTSRARDWNCRCGLLWHLCDRHIKWANPEYSTPRTVPKSKAAESCKGTKRINTLTHDQLVAYDNMRARKRPLNILPPQSNILSSKLRERFAHLLDK